MIMAQSKKLHAADICVIGGGMSGLCAAVAAARHGSKVVLIHDRPVLGGNASSEIRMWIRGAGPDHRETGIVQEVEMENIYRNPTMNYSIWDTVLYQIVKNEENIELLLNCSCLGAEMDGDKIASVTGWQLNSYTFHTVSAKIFMDCSGDCILADLTGAPYRVGRESKDEFDEYGAPAVADRCTMGSSVLIEARETDHKCEFVAPEWAYVYPDDESMYLKNHDIKGTGVNFWWIELGGRQDTIYDAQEINEELLKVAYGVWDHIKNRGDHGMDNWELEWMGFLPGKRESRRYEGAYMLNQRDLEEGHPFDDVVAFGGWTMDNHSPDGFRHIGYSSTHIAAKKGYHIPFRSLYSVAVPNLMFAGRNISASHMAMSSTRVMATCALIGQGAGTGAAVAIAKDCSVAEVTEKHMDLVQKKLMDDGCWLPGLLRSVPETAREGFTPEQIAVLENGWERPQNGESNCVAIADGGSFALTGEGKVLRLALDPDFSRESISSSKHVQKYAMRTHIYGDAEPANMPANMLKSCKITAMAADGTETVIPVAENRKVVLSCALPADAVKVTVSELTSWGGENVNFFACDLS